MDDHNFLAELSQPAERHERLPAAGRRRRISLLSGFVAALDEGVYFAPRCFMNTSTVMDDRVIDDMLEACSRAMARVVGLFYLY
jgi:glutamate-1-semialdehyde aminotransferase